MPSNKTLRIDISERAENVIIIGLAIVFVISLLIIFRESIPKINLVDVLLGSLSTIVIIIIGRMGKRVK